MKAERTIIIDSCGNKGSLFRSKVVVSVLFMGIIMSVFSVFVSLSLASELTARGDRVRVMTRNLYLGADIFRIVDALVDPDPLAVPRTVAEIYHIMQYTDFTKRAEAIADEIERFSPDLIGLQEVTRIRRQSPGDFMQGNTELNASEVVYDYLEILNDALAARGLDYRVAAVVTNADVELPMLTGQDDDDQPLFDDVRLTDHDVILVRGDVLTANPQTYSYSHRLSLPISEGVVVPFSRGFAAVDVEVRGASYRFVNTHLEIGGATRYSPFSLVQAAQMQELLEILSLETKPVILAGDFNSSPKDPESQPYALALEYGYRDVWTMKERETRGYTCCFNETVDDPYARLYERIDHIFLLPRYREVAKVRAIRVGARNNSLTPEGFWPSDHAGVVAGIVFGDN
ncbi:endonuclease/exonuclease/phosphatase family protein [Desulfolithobacter sp.]